MRQAITEQSMRFADEKYRELTEDGERCLTVFRGAPYQMIDGGDRFLFVEMTGYFTDEAGTIDPNAVYNFDALRERMPLFRRHFTVEKSNILSAEIGGWFSGYFDRQCGWLRLYLLKGKTVALYLPGVSNPFTVKRFLGDIAVTIRNDETEPKELRGRGLDKNEPTAIGALMKYFGGACRRLNAVNWLLAALSVALTACGNLLELPFGNLLAGIGALLPLAVFANFLRRRALLSLLVTGIRRKSPYDKIKPEVFSKIVLPSLAMLFANVLPLGFLTEAGTYLGRGFALSMVLLLLCDFFIPRSRKAQRTPEDRAARQNEVLRRLVAAAMCCFYGFMAVIPVNAMAARQIESRVLHYPDSFGYETHDQGNTFRYCGVRTPDGEYRFYVEREEYEKLRAHELSVTAEKFRGLMGIEYYTFRLTETDGEAKKEAEHLDALREWWNALHDGETPVKAPFLR